MEKKKPSRKKAAAKRRPPKKKPNVYLVVGGGGGIGGPTVKHIAEQDPTAFIYVADIDEKAGNRVARRLGSRGKYLHVDVRDDHSVLTLAKEVGPINHLIYTPGGPVGPEKKGIMQLTPKQIRDSVDFNLASPLVFVRIFGNQLKKPAGGSATVSLLSSINGVENWNQAPYSAAKGGIIKVTPVLDMDMGSGVRVNSIAPGSVDTPNFRGEGRNLAAVKRRTSTRRIVKPIHVAKAIWHNIDNEGLSAETVIIDAGQCRQGGQALHETKSR